MNTQVTNNRTRENAENVLNVAMQSAGTYVSKRFNADAYAASVKLAGDAAALGAVDWEKDQRALLSRGEHGTLVRFGHVSKDGVWVRYKGADGAAKVIRRDILADGIAVLSHAELVVMADKLNDMRLVVQVEENGEYKANDSQYGFVVGSVADSYASLLFTRNGKLRAKDVEIKRNAHNAKALVYLGDVSAVEKEREKLRASLLKAAGLGTGEKEEAGEAKKLTAKERKALKAAEKLALKDKAQG